MGDHDGGDAFQEGRRLPTTRHHWPTDDSPWILELDWQVIDGRVECVGVHLTSTGAPDQPDIGVPATTGVLRDVKFPDWIRRLRVEITSERAGPPRRGLMRRSAQRRLEETAAVYRRALAAGGNAPTRAVADHFGISRGGASNLVARAREAGLLPPTSPGAAQG